MIGFTWARTCVLASVLAGFPLTLQWDYEVSAPPNPPPKDYILDYSDLSGETWKELSTFPAWVGESLVLERRESVDTLPMCFRLKATAASGGALLTSEPSNMVCVEATDASGMPFPAPVVALKAKGANSMDLTLGWTPALSSGIVRVVPDGKAVAANSAHDAGYLAAMAVDGVPGTMWHTSWANPTPGHPHTFTMDLGRPQPVEGFTYHARQDNGWHGTITTYVFELGDDGVTWKSALSGTLARERGAQNVRIPQTMARYVRLKSLAALDNAPWASASEIGILVSHAPVHLADLREYVVEHQCKSCDVWEELIRFPALARNILVTTRRLQVRTPRCVRVALTAIDRLQTPAVMIKSEFSPPVCAS